MNYIYEVLRFLMAITINIVMIRILMEVANYLGEKIGFGIFFIRLWQKNRKR